MTDTLTLAEEMAEQASMRSSLYALAAMHFNQRPTDELIEQLRSDEFMDALAAFAVEDEEDSDFSCGYRLMLSYLKSREGASTSELSDEMGIDRTRLYRGISPDYGPTPPYETVWVADVDPNNEVFLSVREAYGQEGFAISSSAHERDDYVGIELDFMRELIEREAAAWRAADEETARSAAAAQKKFFTAHLGLWATRFVDAALEEATTDFYRGHLIAFRGLMDEERAYFDSL